MKKEYIKPIATIYQVGIRNRTCEACLPITSEEDEEDSRQAREYNLWFDEINNISNSNCWDDKW